MEMKGKVLTLLLAASFLWDQAWARLLATDGRAGGTIGDYRTTLLLWWRVPLVSEIYVPPARIVDIQADRSVFNYCDFDSYSRDRFQLLLDLHKVGPSERYVVMYDKDNVDCEEEGGKAAFLFSSLSRSITTEEQSVYFQRLGAVAVVSARGEGQVYQTFYQGPDYTNGIVLGEKSKIDVFGLEGDSFGELKDIVEEVSSRLI
jgi:hypothetical protein